MKKNLTINLFNELYHIDEDAYELLNNYLKSIRNYFSKQEGGEEIADDIENRVGELFTEMKQNGKEVMTIEDVEAVIKRVGELSQLSEGEADNENGEEEPGDESDMPNAHQNMSRGRKFYRDSDDQMLGGVISGLCNYFCQPEQGGSRSLLKEPLFWRFAVLGLIFVGFPLLGILHVCNPVACSVFLTIVYLLFWKLTPEAKTADERLMMRGEPVTTETLSEELMKMLKKSNLTQPINKATNLLQILTSVVKTILKYSVIVVLAIVLALALLGLVLPKIFPDYMYNMMFYRTPQELGKEFFLYWNIGLVGLVIAAFIPIVFLIKESKKNSEEDEETSSRSSRKIWFVIWIIMIVTSIVSFGICKSGLKIRRGQAAIQSEQVDRWNLLQSKEFHVDSTKNVGEAALKDIIDLRTNKLHQVARLQKSSDGPMSFSLSKEFTAKGEGVYDIDLLYKTEGSSYLYFKFDGEDVLTYPHESDALMREGNLWVFDSNHETAQLANKKWKFVSDIPMLRIVGKEQWDAFKKRAEDVGWRYGHITFVQRDTLHTYKITFLQDESTMNNKGEAIDKFVIIDMRMRKLVVDSVIVDEPNKLPKSLRK